MFTTIHGFNFIAMLQCRQEDPLFFLVALAVADFANIWQLSFCSCRAFALRNNAVPFFHHLELLCLHNVMPMNCCLMRFKTHSTLMIVQTLGYCSLTLTLSIRPPINEYSKFLTMPAHSINTSDTTHCMFFDRDRY